MRFRSALIPLLLLLAAPAARAAGPAPAQNPYLAADGAATMHADAESSNASPWPGPALRTAPVRTTVLGAACPTILQGSDGRPVVLCTQILGERPAVYLLDPATGSAVASLSLPSSGNLFGGVYTYLDPQNRMVLFDATGRLVRIGHHPTPSGWTLSVDSALDASPALRAACGASLCGGIVGIAPDWHGRVWFAASDGVAGFVDPASGRTQTLALGHGETVANSISTAPQGTAVATDHALYLLTVAHGRPAIRWRLAYDRGSARKPGQLSHGTGSTPTFFGPAGGMRYLAITDNAAPAEHLLIADTRPAAARHRRAPIVRVVCRLPVLTPGPSGTENNPVAYDRSVFIASTYGYPYPATPAGAEPSQPASAPFGGGLERIDLSGNGRSCHRVWQSTVRSAAVPRLDVRDNRLYTVERDDPADPTGTSDADAYRDVAIDLDDGHVTARAWLGAAELFDTLQLAPAIVAGRVLYQGTITGLVRIG